MQKGLPSAEAGSAVLFHSLPEHSNNAGLYGIHCLRRVDTTSSMPQALVICPTREMAIQSADVLNSLAAGMEHPPQICMCTGDVPIQDNHTALRRTCHVVVGTPGRLCDLLQMSRLQPQGLGLLVLDGADSLDSETFQKDLSWLAQDVLPQNKQVLAFGATRDLERLSWIRGLMQHPILIAPTPECNGLEGEASAASPQLPQTPVLASKPEKLLEGKEMLDSYDLRNESAATDEGAACDWEEGELLELDSADLLDSMHLAKQHAPEVSAAHHQAHGSSAADLQAGKEPMVAAVGQNRLPNGSSLESHGRFHGEEEPDEGLLELNSMLEAISKCSVLVRQKPEREPSLLADCQAGPDNMTDQELELAILARHANDAAPEDAGDYSYSEQQDLSNGYAAGNEDEAAALAAYQALSPEEQSALWEAYQREAGEDWQHLSEWQAWHAAFQEASREDQLKPDAPESMHSDLDQQDDRLYLPKKAVDGDGLQGEQPGSKLPQAALALASQRTLRQHNEGASTASSAPDEEAYVKVPAQLLARYHELEWQYWTAAANSQKAAAINLKDSL